MQFSLPFIELPFVATNLICSLARSNVTRWPRFLMTPFQIFYPVLFMCHSQCLFSSTPSCIKIQHWLFHFHRSSWWLISIWNLSCQWSPLSFNPTHPCQIILLKVPFHHIIPYLKSIFRWRLMSTAQIPKFFPQQLGNFPQTVSHNFILHYDSSLYPTKLVSYPTPEESYQQTRFFSLWPLPFPDVFSCPCYYFSHIVVQGNFQQTHIARERQWWHSKYEPIGVDTEPSERL